MFNEKLNASVSYTSILLLFPYALIPSFRLPVQLLPATKADEFSHATTCTTHEVLHLLPTTVPLHQSQAPLPQVLPSLPAPQTPHALFSTAETQHYTAHFWASFTLRAESLADYQSAVCSRDTSELFCTATGLHRLQKKVKSKRKGNNAIRVRKINSSQNWMKNTKYGITGLSSLPSTFCHLFLCSPLTPNRLAWETCWYLVGWENRVRNRRLLAVTTGALQCISLEEFKKNPYNHRILRTRWNMLSLRRETILCKD